MKFSVVVFLLVALVAGTCAKPAGVILGYQDNLGQYSFGYSAPFQARSEVRSLDGVTRGSYSYVDGAGLVQSTDYTADGLNGFRVAATNLPQAPVPVQDTPEVAAARAAHLLAVEEAVRAVEVPQLPESDGVSVVARNADPEPVVAEVEPEADKEPAIIAAKSIEAAAEPEEPIVEAADQAEAAPEVKSIAVEAEAPAGSEKEAQPEIQQEKGRAIDESAVAPVIASVAAPLPVPLIPVNFDLPSISAYAARPASAKAEGHGLPQATPAQGFITPAGTTLKSFAAPQLVALAPQIGASESAPSVPASSSSSREFGHYERARAVFAPVAPVNVIPLGYDPTIPSFLRYAPFPYIAYNVL